MTTFYFIRHAEAEGNLYSFCQGQYDGGLTVQGEKQLGPLAERFKSIQLDSIYSSDLWRAYATARAAAGNRTVNTDPRLREMDFGQCEGMSWGNVVYRWPEFMDHFYKDSINLMPPDGETPRQVAARMKAAVTDIANRHPGGTVAVVSHGTSLGALFADMSEDGIEKFTMGRFMHNTAVTTVEFDGDKQWNIIKFDDCSHQPVAPDNRLKTKGGSTPIQLRFREADPASDESYIRACGSRAWQAVYGNKIGYNNQRFMENARGIMLDRRHNAFIALDGDDPAGLILLDSRQNDEPDTGHLALIYLEDCYRGQGLGAHLLGRTILEYRSRGMHILRLNVALCNHAALSFYEKHGFVRSGERPHGIPRQVVMYKDISVPPRETMFSPKG